MIRLPSGQRLVRRVRSGDTLQVLFDVSFLAVHQHAGARPQTSSSSASASASRVSAKLSSAKGPGALAASVEGGGGATESPQIAADEWFKTAVLIMSYPRRSFSAADSTKTIADLELKSKRETFLLRV